MNPFKYFVNKIILNQMIIFWVNFFVLGASVIVSLKQKPFSERHKKSELSTTIFCEHLTRVKNWLLVMQKNPPFAFGSEDTQGMFQSLSHGSLC